MSASHTKRARGEAARGTVDAATHDKAATATFEETGAGALQGDRVVVLNVGGTTITTLHSTLTSSPSLLAEWANDGFRQFPRDPQSHPFLDRDPSIFAHIVNYLRGYGLPSKADDLVVVAEDAELFQLEALKREIGLNPPAMWRFTPGPGVREDGVEFSTSDILDLCGTEPLSTGLVHTIVFRMDKCELVSVGVVAFKDIQLDMQIRRQKNSVCYCNTGEFVRCWSTDALYDQGVLYKSQDEITVRVEFAQPGVPLEASEGERALPPPLQPALRLAESLPSSVTMINPSTPATSVGGGGGTVTSAPLPIFASASATTATTAAPSRTTITINASGGASETGVTASALQPGSPVVDASANRAQQPPPPQQLGGSGGRPSALGGVGATATTPASANAPAVATPAVAPPLMGSPATTATAAPGSAPAGGAAPTSPSLPAAPIILDPEDADATIGAIVTFFKGDKEVCRARWPAPVPPLQFAVSMQGASAVSILRASSVSAEGASVQSDT